MGRSPYKIYQKNSIKMAKEKINWLLILQGWAMMWVIIGHCPMGSYGEDSNLIVGLRNFAYSFHMPCFIFISGYLFYLTKIRNSMTWRNMFSDKLIKKVWNSIYRIFHINFSYKVNGRWGSSQTCRAFFI